MVQPSISKLFCSSVDQVWCAREIIWTFAEIKWGEIPIPPRYSFCKNQWMTTSSEMKEINEISRHCCILLFGKDACASHRKKFCRCNCHYDTHETSPVEFPPSPLSQVQEVPVCIPHLRCFKSPISMAHFSKIEKAHFSQWGVTTLAHVGCHATSRWQNIKVWESQAMVHAKEVVKSSSQIREVFMCHSK